MDNLSKEKLFKFNETRLAIQSSLNRLYLYGSLALKELYEKFNKNICKEPYHVEYEPIPIEHQYDLEMYIFLNYEELKIREVTLRKDSESHLYAEKGATLLSREQHLLNAASIRWPEKETPSGKVLTTLAPTPWLRDLYFGISNNTNVNIMGGAGQGKTYGILAFYTMLYDHFIFTKPGAQCTFSTVSKNKLEASSWGYVNKLYNSIPNYKFSLYANKAIKAAEHTYRRPSLKGGNKYNDEGGVFKGVLLQQGVKSDRVVDKLTGSHDPIARAYLLDEAQSTDFAPLNAYTNMFLHPRYKWFNMSGNFSTDEDLFGRNVKPVHGWSSVDETTHMWESRLTSPDESLGQPSLTIHFNNDLSPAILDTEMEKKYASFLPTRKKRDELYRDDKSKTTLAYKRFWIGFRFEKQKDNEIKILTPSLLKDYKADQPSEVKPLINVAGIDTGFVGDRSPFVVVSLGLDREGYPIIWPSFVNLISKPESILEFQSHSSLEIITAMNRFKVSSGNIIIDFTNYTGLIEMLKKHGVVCHGIIYQQKCPEKEEPNQITKIIERQIELPSIKTLTQSGFETNAKQFAHERIKNRITLGAYLFRLFIEAGRVRGINKNILDGENGFDKEILARSFVTKEVQGVEKIDIDNKRKFKEKHKFSPDLLDCLFEVFYMLYVIKGVHPYKKGLGRLEYKKEEKNIDKKDFWSNVTIGRF